MHRAKWKRKIIIVIENFTGVKFWWGEEPVGLVDRMAFAV